MRSFHGLLLFALTVSVPVFAQTAEGGLERAVSATSCSLDPVEYAGKWIVRDVRVEHPFSFLEFVRKETTPVPPELAKIKGSKLRLSDVTDGVHYLRDRPFLPDTEDWRVRVFVVLGVLENCREAEKRLDVVYHVYSSQFGSTLSNVWEFRREERERPQNAVGVADPAPIARLVPQLGYNRTEQTYGGGRLELGRRLTPLFDKFSLEGHGSVSGSEAAASLVGSRDPDSGWLGHAEWRLQYDYRDTPTDITQLRQGVLSAQVSAFTRPRGDAAVVFRFGGLVEGGYQQSGCAQCRLTPDTVSSSAYGSAKSYLGLSWNGRRQSMSASYGLQLGSIKTGTGLDFVKQICDFVYEWWIPVGDHRPLEVESRFTAGTIRTMGRIPLGQRFFGGNVQQDFIAGDTWQIRSNPVIRSIPANRFEQTANGAGADSFFALNLTAALAVWHKPVVPQQVLKADAIPALLDAQITNATRIVTQDYLSRDENLKKTAALLPLLKDTFDQFKSIVSRTLAGAPESMEDEVTLCRGRLAQVTSRFEKAETAKSSALYLTIKDLVEEDGVIGDLLENCVEDANSQLHSAAITKAGEKLTEVQRQLREQFAKIDRAAAEKKAGKEFSLVEHTVHTFLYDLNLISISPVAIFDVARIGPSKADTAGGLRYGVGGGVRFSLVSSVNWTLGYAWNPGHRPGEGPGAFFFGLQFRDLLR